jgi:uncharacterized protein (TIGR03437 family)
MYYRAEYSLMQQALNLPRNSEQVCSEINVGGGKRLCKLHRCVLAVILYSGLLPAQNVITGAGYFSPAPVSAAPGQVITLFVDGVGKALTQPVRATSASWPTSLAGISVTLRQHSEQAVPIFEVRPLSTCPAGSLPDSRPACATLAAITVQIPYELVPLCPLCVTPIAFPPPWLYVTESGETGAAFELNPLADQLHVLTSCDVFLSRFGDPPPQNTTGLRCPPMVTHSDGTLVSASQPAQAGEQLTAWANGLGATDPPAATGQPSSEPLPVTEPIEIDFSFRANALPVKPSSTSPVALYAGLTQGFVGLYQINFATPAAPQGTPSCAPSGTSAPGANAVQSNLTVSFGGSFSFDGAGICIAASKP